VLDRVDDGDQRMDGTVEIGGLSALRADPLGRRDGAGEHRRLDLVVIFFEPVHDGWVTVHHLSQDCPERG
jgi:hypothetical protein